MNRFRGHNNGELYSELCKVLRMNEKKKKDSQERVPPTLSASPSSRMNSIQRMHLCAGFPGFQESRLFIHLPTMYRTVTHRHFHVNTSLTLRTLLFGREPVRFSS